LGWLLNSQNEMTDELFNTKESNISKLP